MATVTIKGFINARKDSWQRIPQYSFSTCKMDEYGMVTVMPYEFEVEIPDDFNMAAAQVKALELAKEEVRRQFNTKIAEINEEISKLQALPFTPAETV